MYVYVFKDYCLQVILYSVNAQGIVERIINARYHYYCYYYYYQMFSGSTFKTGK